MKTSETIAKIAEALLGAQKKIKHAIKDSKNPHFKNNYASLESVIDASKDYLLESGVIVIQAVSEKTLMTRLQHTSGEFMESSLELLLSKNDMQGLGSAITYGRRYALAAMLNISQADDDGNAASDSGQAKPKSDEPKHKDAEPKTAKPEKEPYVFEGGNNDGKKFSDMMPEDFDALLGRYKGHTPKTAALSTMIKKMELFKLEGKNGK